MIEELINREKMNFGVINILLQFVMLKEDMKLPKSYIFEIASNWKKIGISNAKQAYEYALQVNQPKITKHILMINDRTIVEDKINFYPKKRRLNGFKIGTIKKKIKK